MKGVSVSLFLRAEVPHQIPMTRSLEKFISTFPFYFFFFLDFQVLRAGGKKRLCVIFSPSRQVLSKFQLGFITSKMNH